MVDSSIGFDDIINERPELEKGLEFRFYPEGYRQQIFVIWYNAGKPSSKKLFNIIPPWEYNGKKPAVAALKHWIDDVFVIQSKNLDDQVMRKLNEKLVEEKLEMLQRHADTGKEIQDIAFKYIKDNTDKLNINSAARLWIAGVEVERDSRGIPDALKKLNEMSNEDLMKKLEDIIVQSPGELLPENGEEIIDV